jgi:RNA polymerase sigma factor (sigma-70 family)
MHTHVASAAAPSAAPVRKCARALGKASISGHNATVETSGTSPKESAFEFLFQNCSLSERKGTYIEVSAPHETALFADEPDGWQGAALPDAPSLQVAALPTRGEAAEIFALVYRQMRSLVGGRAEFDDLVQIAAEQALRSLPSFEGRSKMSTWTYRICYLTLLKHERWYRRWLRRFALTEPGELSEAEAETAPDDFVLEQLERSARLRRAVAQLSPKRRTVVVLHDLEGLSVEAVARVVEANPLTVRSRLRDGRKDLARILSSDPYFGDEACRPQESEP